jgi:hypothetical protein
MGTPGNAVRFRLISFVIIGTLALQFVAVLSRPGKWLWPFTDYPMYSHSHHEGERIPAKHFVTGLTADGQEIPITAEDVGVNLWVFERWAAALQRTAREQAAGAASATMSIDGGDSGLPADAVAKAEPWLLHRWLKSTWLFGVLKSKPNPDLAPLLLEHLQTERELDLVALRVEDAGVAVSRAGPVPAPPLIHEVKLPLNSDQ